MSADHAFVIEALLSSALFVSQCFHGIKTGRLNPGFRQSPQPSLTVGLLNRPRLKSVARASARAVAQRNNLWDFDGSLSQTLGLIYMSSGEVHKGKVQLHLALRIHLR